MRTFFGQNRYLTMLLYKLFFVTPGQATRRSLSARLVAGARTDDLLARLRRGLAPDTTEPRASRHPRKDH